MVKDILRLCPLIALAAIGIALGIRWRRVPSAYGAQVDRLVSTGQMSRAYARGFVSMFALLSGSLFVVGLALLVHAIAEHATSPHWAALDAVMFPVMLLAASGMPAAFVLAWLHWPTWLFPPHARDDVRSVDELREGR